MTNTENICLNANNSTVPTTLAHETRESFIALMGQIYPQIHAVKFKFKKYYGERQYVLRAKCGRRRLWARGKTSDIAVARFFIEITNKVLLC